MPKIIHLDKLDLTQSYSYADYLTWQLKIEFGVSPVTTIPSSVQQDVLRHEAHHY